MAETGTITRQGDPATAGGPRKSKALEVASGGIRTVQDITNFAIGHSLDALHGAHGSKELNTSLRGVNTGLRSIEIGQRVGAQKEVCNIADDGESSDDALRQREAELTAELERLRERRGA
jgi:hypothetical protein